MIDIKAMAVEAELIEPRDEWQNLPAEYKACLCKFAALVLDKAAEVCDAQGAEWDSDAVVIDKNYAAHSGELIRSLAKEIRS